MALDGHGNTYYNTRGFYKRIDEVDFEEPVTNWPAEIDSLHVISGSLKEACVQVDPNPLIERLGRLYAECWSIARKKNADYASDADPFSNFTGCLKYGVPVAKGMLVRMEDKMRRIGNLLDKKEKVNGESIHDSLMDLSNYALILSAWLEKENA